jgi:FAD-linked oxidoreductase
MISRRGFLAGTALAALYGATRPVLAVGESLPWRNWSGHLLAHPAGRFAPASEAELVDWLRASDGPLRPVGAGHSFSPLVPTNGHLVVLDRLSGLLAHDAERLRATFGAGTRLSDLGPALDRVGQAPMVLPDIDRQTLAGAISTATHGTGIALHSMSGYVTALRLVTVNGAVREIDQRDPDMLRAAAVSLGVLGLITRVELQNREPYRLQAHTSAERTEDVLERFEVAVEQHRHFELFPLTHSDYAIVLAIDETDAPIDAPPVSAEEEAAFGNAMRMWMQIPPGERRPYVNALAEQIGPSTVVDTSYRVLTNVRNIRFNEMEYAVPREVGAQCLREVLDLISRREIDVVFPLEYRYVQGDDLWLSMDQGGDRAAISVHRMAGEDYRPLFDAVEPIFWKYGGRPHWGKLHSLGRVELTRLYPHFEAFRALRAELDPEGRLLNDHLRRVFEP